MVLKTTHWDPSEYLDSPKAIAAYLEAAFEDGEALYKALSPTGDPRLSTFLGVMKALGIKLKPRAA